MTIGFLRPTGAAADVAELEYISALHQTDMPDLRPDGSIRDADIVHFLSSRYGIRVSEEEVRKTVMHGLGGGDDTEDCIDLMELVAVLLIPTLIKAADARAAAGGTAAEEAETKGDGGDDRKDDEGEEDEVIRDTSGNDGGGNNSDEPGQEQTPRRVGATLVQPHRGLLQYAIDMILHDVTGDRRPKPLNRELVRDIFLSYGETDLAEDTVLLDEMVEAAGGGGNKRRRDWQTGLGVAVAGASGEDEEDGQVLLDEKAFARALTGDVRLYDVNNEIRLTTNYFDVFRTHRSSDGVDGGEGEIEEGTAVVPAPVGVDNDDLIATRSAETRPVEKKWTASAIDFAAGTYRSKLLVVALWTTAVLTYFAYFYNEFDDEFRSACQEEGLGWEDSTAEAVACSVLVSIIRWLYIFFSAGAFGLGFVGVGSLGNAIERQGRCAIILPWVGIFFISLSVFRPFMEERRSSDIDDQYLYDVALALGCFVLVLKVFYFIGLCIPKLVLKSRPWLEWVFTPRSFKAESQLKRAAAQKMNKLVKNALDVSSINERESVVDTHYGQALLAFSKLGEKFEHIGGFKWTWTQLFSDDLFTREGIWLSARLLAGNISMVFVAIFVLMSGINLTQRMAFEYDNNEVQDYFETAISNIFPTDLLNEKLAKTAFANSTIVVVDYVKTLYNCTSVPSDGGVNDTYASELCATLESDPKQALLDAGFDVETMRDTIYQSMFAAAEGTANSFYPEEKYMVTAPLITGTVVAFISSVVLVVIYIPSVTSTTLKLRSGVIPTFRNPNFDKYRFGADLVTILLGSMFWGSLASSILVGGVGGSIVFFFVWQVTRRFAFQFIAWIVGITFIIIIRVFIIVKFRVSNFKALYRTKPARANLCNLFLEAASFALSQGFIFVRAIKLLLTTAMYIGRIDTPFLAPGVGNPWGYFELDAYPTIYQRDILAHEAHRHPLIELLGAMYMMKLRYGSSFARQSGSCWRLIFVFALMPWLSKYRILTRSSQSDEDKDAATLQFISLRKVFESTERQMPDGDDKSIEHAAALGTSSTMPLSADGAVEEDVHVDLGASKGESIESNSLSVEEKNALLRKEVAALKRQMKMLDMKLVCNSLVRNK